MGRLLVSIVVAVYMVNPVFPEYPESPDYPEFHAKVQNYLLTIILYPIKNKL